MNSMPTNNVFHHLLRLLGGLHRDKESIIRIFSSRGWDVTRSKIKAWDTKNTKSPGYRAMPRKALEDFIDELYDIRRFNNQYRLENFVLIFDNAGGLQLQTDNYAFYSNDYLDLVGPVNELLNGATTEAWDGNDPEARITYDPDTERAGGYQWVSSGEIVAALRRDGKTPWGYSADKLIAELRKVMEIPVSAPKEDDEDRLDF